MTDFIIYEDLDETFFPIRTGMAQIAKIIFPELEEGFKERWLSSEDFYIEEFIKNKGVQVPESFTNERILRVLGNSKYFFEEPYDNAKEFCDGVYENEGIGIITTSRGNRCNPNKWYDNAYSKTMKWFEIYELRHNGVYFTEDKARTIQELGRRLKPRKSFLLEDSLREINSVIKANPQVTGILIDKPYNQCELSERVIRVRNLREARNKLLELIRE